MEEIYIDRLTKFITHVKGLTSSSRVLCTLKSWSEDDLEQARIIATKLQAMLTRFNNELYQYFKSSNCPNADDISSMTSDQLEGDEALAELNTRIQVMKDKATSSKASSATHRGKLPELNLPTFAGDVLQWTQFWDQFCSNIDQRDLRDVDKLLYLKASLKGEASTVIDGLETTNDNYQVAVTTLTNRYGKKTQIIDTHYSTLYKLKRAEKQEDCRKTLDEIERHLRVLSSLGENTEHNHLRFLILEKFPEDVIYELKLKLNNETVEEIRKQLHIVLSAREDARRTYDKKDKEDVSYTTETLHVKEERFKRKSKSNNSNTTNSSNKRSKANLTAFNKTQNMKRKFKEDKQGPSGKREKICCIFCQESHFNDECTNSKTIAQRKLKLNNRCYKCFRLGHSARNCRNKNVFCPHCRKKGHHNRALCPNREQAKREASTALHVYERGSTILQTAVVEVEGPDCESMKCRVLLDSGSMRSYVTEKTARKLNLKVEDNDQLIVFTFGSDKPQKLDSSLVKLHINTRTNKRLVVYANVVPSITNGISTHSQELEEWKHQNDYLLADDGSLSDRVDILIGNDYFYTFMSTEKVELRENLYLVNSEFGWILSGKTTDKFKNRLSALTYFQASYETRLNEPDLPLNNSSMKALWDLESIGITDSPNASREEETIKHFNENTILTNGRYYVSWPWKEYPPELQSNFGLAYGRLIGLLKRMNTETLEAYKQTFNDQLKKGVIEPVPIGGETGHPVHYLPHHGVLVPGKALRIVYDASAKTKDNKSLNECLYCGPMMLEDLTGLLIKFRCHAIGITADVEKAFLQIGLKEEDRDVTRFLWLKDTNRPATEDNLIHYRFTRVPFGIISSPFLLNATIKYHLQNSKGRFSRQLAEDIYVDNILTGAETLADALKLYKEGKELFSEISMNLREWSSNSKEFLDQIPDAAKETNVKALGLNWNLENDALRLRTKVNEKNDTTKRGILRTIAAVYDPCGFGAPILLPAKLLLQQLWKKQIKWDAPLPEDLSKEWKTILVEMKELESICLPRNITIPDVKDAQIHCFTDSSTVAYSAVIYLVQKKTVNFIIGKSRLVPIKDQENLKIPRLELLGVLIGSRLIKYVLKFLHLNITQLTLWTDSQIVLDWYHSNKLLTPFVSRRLEEIKQNKSLVLRYVPSTLNPADVATRPTTSEEERSKWLCGPEFLKQNQNSWPTGPPRVVSLLTGEGLLNTEGKQTTEAQDEGLMSVKVLDPPLQEIKELQEKMFLEESKGNKTHLSHNLGLFKDTDGIIRCEGRLTHSDLSFDAKHPILLPKNCEFTEKIIKEIHDKNLHVGVPHTLSLIRQKYWIPQGRAQVKRILSRCARCVKHGGGPYELPKTPALPPERVKYTSAYTYVGVDYFGPMFIRTENGQRKRWICLFTCLVIRAIHLEVVKNLTTDECLMAFRRFIASRGTPSLILSDNAPQFRLLAEIMMEERALSEKIRWKFIPQLAPWHGGAYERLVAVVKHCLKRTLEKHMLEENQLLTIIKEVEAVVNTRPLTYVGAEMDHILKPADFLTPGRCLNIQVLTDNLPLSGSVIKQQLIEGWKRGNMIMNEYKDMFVNQYLLSLRERYRNSPKQARVRSHKAPQIGDVVQIKGDTKNRESWKVGKIVELIKGKDDLIRVAKVKVDTSIFTRSIAQLYPLEVEEEPEQRSSDKTHEQDAFKETYINDDEYLISMLPMEIDNASISQSAGISGKKDDNTETAKTKEQDLVQDTRDVLEVMSSANDIELTADTYSSVPETQSDESNKQIPEERQRRTAAVQAMEKIHKWTRDLMTTIV